MIGVIDLTSATGSAQDVVVDLTDDDEAPLARELFALQRQDRSQTPGWVLFRPPRSMEVTSLSVLIGPLADRDIVWKNISQNNANEFIQHCIQNFSVNSAMQSILERHIAKAVFLDQGQWNACSYVSFVHLTSLLANQRIDKQWLRTWNKISPQNTPFADIGSMLDALLQSQGQEPLPPGLRYVPFRTSDEGENRFNSNLPVVQCGTTASTSTSTGSSENGSGEAAAGPLVCSTPYDRIRIFFESHLDSGVPIAFNHLQHSRVAIAHSLDSVLCIDSMGKLLDGRTKYVHFCGGVSVVQKRSLYQWVRDAMYYIS